MALGVIIITPIKGMRKHDLLLGASMTLRTAILTPIKRD